MISHRAVADGPDGPVLILTPEDKLLSLQCTVDQYKHGMEAYKKGALIQTAFPFLTDPEREFLMTGIYPREFRQL